MMDFIEELFELEGLEDWQRFRVWWKINRYKLLVGFLILAVLEKTIFNTLNLFGLAFAVLTLWIPLKIFWSFNEAPSLFKKIQIRGRDTDDYLHFGVLLYVVAMVLEVVIFNSSNLIITFLVLGAIFLLVSGVIHLWNGKILLKEMPKIAVKKTKTLVYLTNRDRFKAYLVIILPAVTFLTIASILMLFAHNKHISMASFRTISQPFYVLAFMSIVFFGYARFYPKAASRIILLGFAVTHAIIYLIFRSNLPAFEDVLLYYFCYVTSLSLVLMIIYLSTKREGTEVTKFENVIINHDSLSLVFYAELHHTDKWVFRADLPLTLVELDASYKIQYGHQSIGIKTVKDWPRFEGGHKDLIFLPPNRKEYLEYPKIYKPTLWFPMNDAKYIFSGLDGEAVEREREIDLIIEIQQCEIPKKEVKEWMYKDGSLFSKPVLRTLSKETFEGDRFRIKAYGRIHPDYETLFEI